MATYGWRSWHYEKYNANKVYRELNRLRKRLKKEDINLLNPTAIVEEARVNPNLELHKMFEWNIKKAAQAHWEEQARAITRHLVEIRVVDDEPVPVRVFVHVTREEETGYSDVETLDVNEQTQIINEAMRGLESWMKRYAELAIRIPGLLPLIRKAVKMLLASAEDHEEKVRKVS